MFIPNQADKSVLKYCTCPLFLLQVVSLVLCSAEKLAYSADTTQGSVLSLIRPIQTEGKTDFL